MSHTPSARYRSVSDDMNRLPPETATTCQLDVLMHISIHSPGQCTRISASATSGKYLIFPQAFLLHEVKREPAENPPSVTSTTWEMTGTYVPHGWRRISQETMPVAIDICTAARIKPTIK